MRPILAALPVVLLAACGLNGTDRYDEEGDSAATAPAEPANLADSMSSNDPPAGMQVEADIPDSQQRPVMQAQVVLDRIGFGPGVIDGKMGMSTENAIDAFQESRELPVTGELDEATKAALADWDNIPATRVVTIPQEWASLTFEKIPDGAEGQSKMDRLGYESLEEKLAERFHTTVEVLQELNPGGRPAGAGGPVAASPSPTSSPTSSSTQAEFAAGQRIRVPNIGADRIAPDAIADEGWQQTLAALGVGSDQPHAARIVVDKSGKWLKAYDSGDNLVAAFTVTSGSEHDPLPLGDWGINGVGRNPEFAYNPELFWDVPDSEPERMLPPGPNGPVGVVWIDLTKEHYGIHGTSAPETIGRVQSHGCVRLTNWDAARLAGMVDTSTKVVFQA